MLASQTKEVRNKLKSKNSPINTMYNRPPVWSSFKGTPGAFCRTKRCTPMEKNYVGPNLLTCVDSEI